MVKRLRMRTNFALNKRDMAEMNTLVEKLEKALNDHRRLPTIMVLSRVMPLMWCELLDFETTTEALDLWRKLAIEMEDVIRNNFGAMRYKDGK